MFGDFFADDFFAPDYFADGPPAGGAAGGRGRGVGGRRGVYVDWAAAEQSARQAQQAVAVLTLERLLALRSEFESLVALDEKRRAEDTMYSVLLAEL